MYDLEIGKIINIIKKNKAKSILLQLPDGLKPKANIIQQELNKNTDIKIYIFAGSCYGACDTPILEAKFLKADLLVQWGHSKWK